MTRVSDFEGRLVLNLPEPLRMPISLRVPPIEGLVVTELAPDRGWEYFDFGDTVAAVLFE